MKKMLFLALMVLTAAAGTVLAQTDPDLYRSLLISEEDFARAAPVPEQPSSADAADAARTEARKLLQTSPRTLRRQNFPKLRQHNRQTAVLSQDAQSGPFGLIWGASIAETRNQGINLRPVGEKDYVNNFSATRLPKSVSGFSRIDVTFGEDNRLWRIIAYGRLLDDNARASLAMQEYQKYNRLLTQKYGHAEEFYTPAQIDKVQKDARGRETTVQEAAPIGNPDFLSQLQSGAADLYSTYYNDEVGAALAVNVDGDGKSYIVIDYKNLNIMHQMENKTLDAL